MDTFIQGSKLPSTGDCIGMMVTGRVVGRRGFTKPVRPAVGVVNVCFIVEVSYNNADEGGI